MTREEASDLIEAAILQAMTTMEGYDSNDVVVDWVAIAYVANPDSNKGGYPTFYSNAYMATYRARGLFLQGLLT